jgi:hypothetical protein
MRLPPEPPLILRSPSAALIVFGASIESSKMIGPFEEVVVSVNVATCWAGPLVATPRVFQPVLDALSPKTTSAADKFEAAAQKTLDDSRQKEAKRRASCAVILDERVGVIPIRPIGVFECITTTVWVE